MGIVSDKTIGKQIRERRTALGLSVEGLAYKAGISYKTVERLEAGLAQPRRATLTVIEQALAAEQEEIAA